MTITETITPKKQWNLEEDEFFVEILDSGRRIQVRHVSFWPDEPDNVWVEGIIIRKDTGTTGSYWSRGWANIEDVPSGLLLTIMKQWISAGV